MKKIGLAIAVAFTALTGVQAQSMMETVQIGARAGYNYSTLSGDTAQDLDTKGLSGYHVGLVAEFPVSDRFSIQPEVLYSTQGAKWEVADNEIEFKTQNINIPVLAKFYVAEGFNVQVGPQIGINTDSEWDYDGTFVNDTFEVDDDATSDVNFGAIVGLGYKVAENFTVDARYNFGLTNVFDDENDSLRDLNISDDNDFKNSVFSVGIGYQF